MVIQRCVCGEGGNTNKGWGQGEGREGNKGGGEWVYKGNRVGHK